MKQLKLFADYPRQMMTVPTYPRTAKEICEKHGIRCKIGKGMFDSDITIKYDDRTKDKLGPCLVELLETLPLSLTA